jgi:hypothetical protein
VPAFTAEVAVDDVLEDDAANPTLLLDRSIDFSMLFTDDGAALLLNPEEASKDRMMMTNPSRPITLQITDSIITTKETN